MTIPQKRVFSVAEGAEYVGLGRSKFLELVYRGEINLFMVGRRRLFVIEDLHAFVDLMRQQTGNAQPAGAG